jgi:hypothetical protein
MLTFAILSLALAILIWLACYGCLILGEFLGSYIGQIKGAYLGFLGCAALIMWGIWFIARRWPQT